jgi:rhodanese-related sulfurtransferase
MTRLFHPPQKALSGLQMVLLLCVSFLHCSSGLDWGGVKNQIRSEFPTVEQISAEELKNWMQSDRSKPLLLDARSEEEFQVSHLEGALSAVDFRQAEKRLAQLDKDFPVVVYCSVGYRSSSMAESLQDAGYEKVYNLEGSIFEWVNSGNPVYREGQEVSVVHPYDEKWGQLLDREFWSREF